MNDTPKKILTLKKKRVIKRADLPAGKLSKPGKAPAKAKQQHPKKPKPSAPKKQTTPPSEIRARELYERLNQFPVWREYQPLAIGIEKAIFKLCNDEQFPGASKKVVQKVLSRHTRRDVYRANLTRGGKRYHLEGQVVGSITEDQKSFAAKQLK